MSSEEAVYIIGMARTPMGTYQGISPLTFRNLKFDDHKKNNQKNKIII